MDPLEERVRRGLHDDRWRVSPIDPDDTLDRVHTGAARRRRRRTVATAVAGVVVIAGAAGGVGLLNDGNRVPDDGNTVASDPHTTTTNEQNDQPKANQNDEPKGNGNDERPGRNGDGSNNEPKNDPPDNTPTVKGVPSDFQAVSLTATSTSTYWVLGSTDQDGASVAVTGDGGANFDQIGTIDAAVPPEDDETSPDTVRDIRFVDSNFGWAYGGGLWWTDDGGQTWERSFSLEGTVTKLEIDDGQAYALVRDGTSWQLWRSSATSDSWEQLDVQLVDPEGLAVTGSLVAVTDRPADYTVAWVSEGAGGQFESRPTPCNADLDSGELSASEGSLWLKCATGTAAEVHLSTDAGQQWTPVNTGPESLPNVGSAVGARSATEAVAAIAGEVRRMEPSGAGVSPVPALDQPVYAGFTTTSVGYVVDLDGELFRTADGGEKWSEVAVE